MARVMELREISYFYEAISSKGYSDPSRIAREINSFYSEEVATRKATFEESLGFILVSDDGMELAITLRTYDFDSFKNAIDILNKNLPKVAAYFTLLKERGEKVKSKMDIVKNFLPSEIKVLASYVSLEELANIIKDNANRLKVFDEDNIRRALRAIDIASKCLSVLTEDQKKDTEFLQGVAIEIANNVDNGAIDCDAIISNATPTNEIEEILKEVRKKIVASSVIMTEGINNAGITIGSSLTERGFNFNIKWTTLISKISILQKIQNANTLGGKLKYLIEGLLQLKLKVMPAVLKDGDKYYGGTAIGACSKKDSNKCDIIAIFARNANSSPTLIEITSELLTIG